MSRCFKCGIEEGKIVKHHTSYNPENIVDCCQSCHLKIHRRIRKEGSCPISVKETNKLSKKLCHQRQWRTKQIQAIDFYEALGLCVRLKERIKYNHNTGTVSYISGFIANNNNHLYTFKEELN